MRAFSTTSRIVLAKRDNSSDFTFVLGVCLIPGVGPNGEIFDADAIELAAHSFVEDSRQVGVDGQRTVRRRDCVLVESYVVRSPYVVNGTSVPQGAWVVGLKIYSPAIREAIRSGRFKGFGVKGIARPRV